MPRPTRDRIGLLLHCTCRRLHFTDNGPDSSPLQKSVRGGGLDASNPIHERGKVRHHATEAAARDVGPHGVLRFTIIDS